MKSLISIIEGLLDSDFDITDSDIMPGVKNWSRFYGRLKSVGKYHNKVQVDQPYLGKNRSTIRYNWNGVDLAKALTEGISKDVGGKKIGRNKAWDAAIDSEQCILAMFNDPWKPYSTNILIGTGQKALFIKTDERGALPITYIEVITHLTISIQSLEIRNWTIKLGPLQMYDQIKQVLGIP